MFISTAVDWVPTCAKHRPFAVYRPEVDKTFFCYGGTPLDAHLKHTGEDLNGDRSFSRERGGFLLHMVSYFDHKTGQVPRPTILLDKNTADAHDNPVISIDDDGYIWIFSTSHGLSPFLHSPQQRTLHPTTSTSLNRSMSHTSSTVKNARWIIFPICKPGNYPIVVSSISSHATKILQTAPSFL